MNIPLFAERQAKVLPSLHESILDIWMVSRNPSTVVLYCLLIDWWYLIFWWVGHLEIVQLLLEKNGAIIDDAGPNQYTPLYGAARGGMLSTRIGWWNQYMHEITACIFVVSISRASRCGEIFGNKQSEYPQRIQTWIHCPGYHFLSRFVLISIWSRNIHELFCIFLSIYIQDVWR